MATISIKSVKILEHASEETTCFEAAVYVDNKKAGYASNDGHGGMTLVRLEPQFGDLQNQKFEVECFCDGDKDSCFACHGTNKYDAPLDEYIDHLLEKHRQEKVIAKLKKQGRNVAIRTSSSIYGLTTKSQDEAAIRKAFAKQCTDTIKELRFL